MFHQQAEVKSCEGSRGLSLFSPMIGPLADLVVNPLSISTVDNNITEVHLLAEESFNYQSPHNVIMSSCDQLERFQTKAPRNNSFSTLTTS